LQHHCVALWLFPFSEGWSDALSTDHSKFEYALLTFTCQLYSRTSLPDRHIAHGFLAAPLHPHPELFENRPEITTNHGFWQSQKALLKKRFFFDFDELCSPRHFIGPKFLAKADHHCSPGEAGFPLRPRSLQCVLAKAKNTAKASKLKSLALACRAGETLNLAQSKNRGAPISTPLALPGFKSCVSLLVGIYAPLQFLKV